MNKTFRMLIYIVIVMSVLLSLAGCAQPTAAPAAARQLPKRLHSRQPPKRQPSLPPPRRPLSPPLPRRPLLLKSRS